MIKQETNASDLALENALFTHTEFKVNGFRAISSELGGKKTVTLRLDDVNPQNNERITAASRALTSALYSALSSYNLPPSAPVTVICLGNISQNADSLGPLCAKKILATRHLKNDSPSLFSMLGNREISVITAGVTSETGVNALEIAKMYVLHLGARLLITVDALKASKTENLMSVVQISSGVVPGSGVGNSRPEIDKKSIGIPVISIGVPTVISTYTIAKDIQKKSSIAPAIRQNPKNADSAPPLLVSRADCDEIVSAYAEIISTAINSVLLGDAYV